MTTLRDMVGPVLKKAGKGKPLSRDEFLILLLDRIFLRASNSFFKGQFSYLPRAASGLKPDKILVILFSSIGDVVYSTPVIQALREKYPDSFISFLVEEDAYPVVEDNPYLDEVILLPFKDWQNLVLDSDPGRGGDLDGLLEELRRFTSDLKERRYDYLLNLHLSPRSALITHLACAKHTNGFSLKEDGQPLIQGSLWNLYEYLIAVRPETMKDYNRINLAERSLRMAGLEPVRREAAFFLSREKEEKVKAILDELRIDDDDLLIGLNPGSNYPARRWLPERFAGLADSLIREFGAKVIIFGGPGDTEIAEGIIKMMEEEAINLAGKSSLWELAGIIKRCD
ncbi:glycosyltransferase family 9 protein, partial [bacterium]|nr:glycosyltransferase family 9 protein [bacterium]